MDEEKSDMKNRTKLCGLLLLTWFWLPESQAVLLLIENNTTTSLTFANPNDFSGAKVATSHSLTQTADAAGDSANFTFNFSGPSFNVAVTGDSHVAISAINVLPALVSFTHTSTDGLTGKFALAYDRFANMGVTLATTVSGGFNILRYRTSVILPLVPGSPYTFHIEIPGDWSVSGSASGNHTLLDINPLWTIDQNFVFSGGVTIFSGHIDSYTSDGAHDPEILYRLVGSAAAIPEPACWTLLSLGLAGLGFSRRKKT